MIKFFKEFFQLTTTELKGAFVFLFLIILIFIAPRIYFYFQKMEIIEDKDFLAWADEINHKDSIAYYSKSYKNIDNQDVSYFKFDPNTVSFEEMKQLGIDSKTANTIVKFRDKGAKFYNKEDLLRIYSFDIALYEKLEAYIIYPTKNNKSYDKKGKSTHTERFPFDPNTVTYKEMMALGFDSKTASILLKFREKGAKFYTKQDLLKIYSFTEELYAKIEDYIIYPEKDFSNKKEQSAEIPTLYYIDINKADSADLVKLKGIGAFYAKTIIEYRNKLGGFYKIEQLKEVYGVNDEVYAKIENFVVVENPQIKKININTATFGELIKHPYLDKEAVNKILKLHKQIGGFLKIEDLRSYSALTESQFENVKYYLKVD